MRGKCDLVHHTALQKNRERKICTLNIVILSDECKLLFQPPTVYVLKLIMGEQRFSIHKDPEGSKKCNIVTAAAALCPLVIYDEIFVESCR